MRRGQVVRWRAPGRVNLIGEHTDYNDGFALPLAIEQGVSAVVRSTGQGWRATSAQESGVVHVPINDSLTDVPGWARYAMGAARVLSDRGHDVGAFEIVVDGDVPLGAGLSSSAALACSTLTAIAEAFEIGLAADELLSISRSVENDVVGAPTGGMDQLISLRGVAGHALLCDMRSLDSEPVPFDPSADGLSLLVIDTRAPHRHVDGEYAARRHGCVEAARLLGVAALRDVDDLGAALLRLPDETLRQYARHVVTENLRVLATADLLRAGRLREIGPLLSESHASMRDDFAITVPQVDRCAEALEAAGALGARMTGGGFGGCVIGLLPHTDVGAAVDVVRRLFADSGWAEPGWFVAQASAGAHRL